MIVTAFIFLMFSFMMAFLGMECFKSKKQVVLDTFVGSLLMLLAMVCLIASTYLLTHGG